MSEARDDTSRPDEQAQQEGHEPDAAEEGPQPLEEPRVFQHPTWMVGVVLIFAMVSIVAGLENPVWWIVGSPFILALVVFLWVRFFAMR